MHFNNLKLTTVAILSVLFSFCFTQDVVLSLDGGNLNYESNVDIAGFQFSHTGCVAGASGGDAAANGFTISSSGSTVLAFSFTGSVIPAGDGTLVELAGDVTEDCLSEFIFSDSSGDALDVELGGTTDDTCDDTDACNYGQEGDCEYAEENYDCDGNCTVDTDCAGECGGDAVVDECGECGGSGAGYECWDGSVACDASDCPDEPGAQPQYFTDLPNPTGESSLIIIQDILGVIQNLANRYRFSDNYQIIINNGSNAGQEVPH